MDVSAFGLSLFVAGTISAHPVFVYLGERSRGGFVFFAVEDAARNRHYCASAISRR